MLNKVEGSSDTMYLLVGPPPAELASHVNHKVEVTGQVRQPNLRRHRKTERRRTRKC